MKSNSILLLTLIVVSWVNFNTVRWQNGDTINHDVAGYYSYLPAVFYEKDPGLRFLNGAPTNKNNYYYSWSTPGQDEKKVLKYSMGMALTYLPFFALAHLYTLLSGDATNGFSSPYHFAIQFSSLIYLLIGLYYLQKVLLHFFDQRSVLLSLICIIFGSNLLYYLTIGAGMPHATNFALFSIFIYQSMLWHKQPSFKLSIYLGLSLGLLTLIRPINLLMVLIFIFYGISSSKSLKEKYILLRTHFLKLLITGLTLFLIFFPQMLYWKWTSGQYLFNSYVGEGFFFSQPQIINGLFSFRKGWLLYSPMMALALTGIFFLKHYAGNFLTGTLILLPIYIYCVFSWWCWWYGGSFGQRAMIDLYPLLALPLAALFQYFSTARSFFNYSLICLASLLFLLNVFQTMQAKWNTIHYDSMTGAAYQDAFLRLTKNPEREKYLQHPDYDKALRGEKEYP